MLVLSWLVLLHTHLTIFINHFGTIFVNSKIKKILISFFYYYQVNGGPQYYHNTCQTHRESTRYNGDDEGDGLVMQGSDCGYMPEMRDNECQTRESLFFNTSLITDASPSKSTSSISPSPPPPCTIRRSHIRPANALPPVNTPPIDFVTFGKNNQKQEKIAKNAKEHRFRAEAVIEVERFKTPVHDTPPMETKAASRPYSVQSTKSAPDVIVTHWHPGLVEWEPYQRRTPRPYLKSTGSLLPLTRSKSLVSVRDSVAQCNLEIPTNHWLWCQERSN